MESLIRFWPAYQGQGWDLPKFQEQLHVPGDIEHNGSPQGYHTGVTKHFHIPQIKRTAVRAQRRWDVLDQQIGDCITESYFTDYSHQRMIPNVTLGDHVGELPTQHI